MNRINILGNITKDIELKETGSGIKYTRFNIAVNRNYKNENGEYDTDFFNVIAWRKTAELISEYFGKGSRIAISGKLQNNNYTDKDGNERTSVEIVAEDIDFIDKKKDTEANTEPTEKPKVEESNEDIYAEFGDSIEVSDSDIAF